MGSPPPRDADGCAAGARLRRQTASSGIRRFRHCPLATLHCPHGGVRAVAATRPLARLAGLAGLGAGSSLALLIPRCRSVHTAGMRFPLDVVFLAWTHEGDAAGRARDIARVLALREGVLPLRLAAAPRRAAYAGAAGRRGVAALELPAGSALRLGLRPGAPVVLEPPPELRRARLLWSLSPFASRSEKTTRPLTLRRPRPPSRRPAPPPGAPGAR